MRRSFLFAAVVLAMSAAPAFAQSQSASAPHKTTATSDRHFIEDAAQGGMAEVELGKLAETKTSNDEVKKFAERMVDDHGKANDELKGIASRKNITWPIDLDAKNRAMYDRLSKLSGRTFDRAYMQAMLKDHRTDVNEFKTRARVASDPDVKEFASKHLPTLESHLTLAETTNGAIGTAERPRGTTGTTTIHK